jgi:predicted PhzF superfamily epimerase YddE/YHI9
MPSHQNLSKEILQVFVCLKKNLMNCALVPFWSEKTGKKDFVSHQVSKRSGILKTSLKGNRVEISGMARTIFKAELFV